MMDKTGFQLPLTIEVIPEQDNPAWHGMYRWRVLDANSVCVDSFAPYHTEKVCQYEGETNLKRWTAIVESENC